MKVVVTGATGNVGTSTVQALSESQEIDEIVGLARREPTNDRPDRADEDLISVIPRDARKVYKMRPIVETLVDAGSFFEFGKAWGKSVITGLARLDGWPVAILASDPYHYGGAWTADACAKTVRFVDMAETFHLPVVYLCDCPGFLIGLEAEKAALASTDKQAPKAGDELDRNSSRAIVVALAPLQSAQLPKPPERSPKDANSYAGAMSFSAASAAAKI